MDFLGLYNYWIVILLMMMGFYVVIASGHLVKKLIGLNLRSEEHMSELQSLVNLVCRLLLEKKK